MKITVIVSTYNNPQSLEKCLWGFACQSDLDFDLLIADDGSTSETRDLISRFAKDAPFSVRHLWQEDRGFRKARILNQAINAATGDYLVFTDGDCIPRADFLAAHRRFSRPGYFIAGGSHVNITPSVHLGFTRADVASQRVFEPAWLRAGGVRRLKSLRLTTNSAAARLLDVLTPRPGAFVGNNASAWKADLIAVNGFDESYTGYGSEDRDLGVRLTKHGIKSRRLKYSLVCIHLDHPKPYAAGETAANARRLQQAKSRAEVRAARGIDSTQE